MKPFGLFAKVMARSRLSLLAISAIALVAAGGAACAQSAPAPSLILAANDFASSNYGPGPVTTGRTLEWDSRKGRWGLRLGMEQHTDRFSEWRDVQPGLYYKLTPRLNIGGAVSLSPPPAVNPRLVDPQGHSPRVRLETTFKF